MPGVPSLERYTGNSIAEQVGVVRLQDDATALVKNLLQGTTALAETADTMAKHAEVEYIANFQLDQRKKAAELQVKHSLDPVAFQSEYQAHSKATMAAVPLVFQKRAALSLKAVGESHYEDVLNRTAANTRTNAINSWDAERKQKEADYLTQKARVLTGQSTPDQAEAARVAYSLHLEDGVRLRVIDEKMSDVARNSLAVKAHVESVTEGATQIWDAAMKRGNAEAVKGGVDEGAFQTWYKKQAEKFGLSKNPDDPQHFYDWRAAYKAEAKPDAEGHWPSKFKREGHPNQIVKGVDTRTGKPVGEGGDEVGDILDQSKRKLGTTVGQDPNMKTVPFDRGAGDKTAAPPAPPGAPDTGDRIVNARKAVDKYMEQFKTDPMFAPMRSEVTIAAVEASVRRKIHEAEADYARQRELNNENYNTFVQRLASGLNVDSVEAASRANEARNLGDRKGAARWDMIVTKGAALAEFSQMPFAQQAADLQATRAKAQANPGSESALFEYEIKKSVAERARAEFARDSLSYARNAYGRDLPPPANIDFTKPDVAELKSRANMVSVLQSRAGAEISPFSAEEESRFASTMKAASAVDRGNILATLNDGLGSKLAQRVLGKLSKDGNVDRALVFAAGVPDPVLRREILEGMDVLATEKNAAPTKPEDFQRMFNDYAGTAFGRSQGSTNARDSALEAAKALSAKWAKDNGKIGQDMDPTEAAKIIKRVVGSVVTHNGGKLLPPRRDMTQGEWDTAILAIQDQDAPPLRGLDGKTTGITTWVRSGQLENIGDGKYVIRFGESYYATDPRDPSGRTPYILDRAFFQRVETRWQYQEFGDFAAGRPTSPRPTKLRTWRPEANPAPDWMRE